MIHERCALGAGVHRITDNIVRMLFFNIFSSLSIQVPSRVTLLMKAED